MAFPSPASRTRIPTPLALALASLPLLIAAAWPGRAMASDAHADHAKLAAAMQAGSAAASEAPAASAAAQAPARPARGPKDPMDIIRERLAAKLGAAGQAGASGPDTLRVVAKTALSAEASKASKTAEPKAPAAESGAEHAAPPVATAHPVAAHPVETPLPSAPAATVALATVTAPAPVRRRPVAAARTSGASGALQPLAVTGTALSAPAVEHVASPHWDYQGNGGPERWASLQPEFSKCSTGTRQSPIDIRDGIRVQLEPVRFDYRPSGFRVIDNGHTVQVNVAAGNSIEIMGRRYELVQFHFHRPSEERINGRQFDMVAHLVHKDLEGRLAVVAVLLDRGSAQPVVQAVWNNLPLEKGEELAAPTPLDLNALLPKERSYFTYMGSLTTPPCSEGVLWVVMREPVGISPEQIGIFSRLYPMNARPLQAASGRLIKESN